MMQFSADYAQIRRDLQTALLSEIDCCVSSDVLRISTKKTVSVPTYVILSCVPSVCVCVCVCVCV